MAAADLDEPVLGSQSDVVPGQTVPRLPELVMGGQKVCGAVVARPTSKLLATL